MIIFNDEISADCSVDIVQPGSYMALYSMLGYMVVSLKLNCVNLI